MGLLKNNEKSGNHVEIGKNHVDFDQKRVILQNFNLQKR